MRPESWWRKTGERGSPNSVPGTLLRGEVKQIAVIGPLQLPAAKSHAAVLSYAVMRPGDNSRVHTHPGPEGWYVLEGEQCLETPDGAATGSRRGNHAGASEHPDGVERHWHDAPVCVRPGHP